MKIIGFVFVLLFLLGFATAGDARIAGVSARFDGVGDTVVVSIDGNRVDFVLDAVTDSTVTFSVDGLTVSVPKSGSKSVVIADTDVIIKPVDSSGDVVVSIAPQKSYVDLAIVDVVNKVDSLTVSICNKGTVASSDLSRGVLVNIDGGATTERKLEVLSPGDCVKESFVFDADTSGNTQEYAKIVVDPEQKSGDIFLDNNFRVVPLIDDLTVSNTLPDLIISDIQVHPKNPAPTDQLVITFTVKNVGDAPAKVAWVDPSSSFSWLTSTIVFINDDGLNVLPWNSQDLEGFIGAPRLLNHLFEYTINDGTIKFTNPSAELFLQPGDEVRLSMKYFRGTNQPSLIKTGKNTIRVFVDRLYPQQPVSGIITESNEDNNYADFEFESLADPGFDTEAFAIPCSRVNGERYISNQFNRIADSRDDYDEVLSYVLVDDSNFYELLGEPYPFFDPMILYSSLYEGYDSVVDASGDEHKIYNVKPSGRLSYGAHYWDSLPSKGKLLGVITTKHRETGVSDHSVVYYDLDKTEDEWACPQIQDFDIVETVPEVLYIVGDVDADVVDVSDSNLPGQVVDDSDDNLGDSLNDGNSGISRSNVFARFWNWLKRVFT